MSAAVAYYLRLAVYRQSFIPSMLAYLGLLAVIFAADAGPVVPAAVVTAIALMPVSAWLMRATSQTESQPFADMTAVALGGATRRLLARAGAAATVGGGLTVASLVWSAVANPQHAYTWSTVLIVVGMHLAQVVAGVGVGALLSPPLPVTSGIAAIAATSLALASLLVAWIPPMGPMLRHLDHTPVPDALTLLFAIAQAAAAGAVALLAAAAITPRAP